MSNNQQNANMDILLKEIDLIQNCISRMEQNSFIVKGWVITLIAGCCAISTFYPNDWKILLIFSGIAIILFWYLDAFFLKTQKLYRYKYEWVIKNRKTKNIYSFDLNPNNENMWEPDKKEPSMFITMLSKTLLSMYVPLLIFDAITFCLL